MVTLVLDVRRQRTEIGDADRLGEVARLPPPSGDVARSALEPSNELSERDRRRDPRYDMNVVDRVPDGDQFAAKIGRRLPQQRRQSFVVRA